jgi:Predicted permease YjgP/YjgQ family.
MPIVISVILFIIYYIIENIGYKMTRDGVWAHWFGMWFSSLILTPIGIFLTYKAMNDSVIMNADTYVDFFKRLFFIREKRKYSVKSVIIDKPEYGEITSALSELSEEIDRFLEKYNYLSYKTYWTDKEYDRELQSIKSSLEIILSQLSNSRNLEELSKAEAFPVLINNVRPFKTDSSLARISMYVFPVGIVLRLLSIPFELRIRNDLKNIQRLGGELIEIIESARVPESVTIA